MHCILDPNTLETPSYMHAWVSNTALVLSHSYVLNNIAFIFITAAFKEGIDTFICKPKPFNFSRTFLIFFFPILIPFFSLFLYILPKCYCITRILMNYSISGSSTFMQSNVSISSSRIH